MSILTENDRQRSATASGMPLLFRALRPLQGSNINRILDIGCGFGGITREVGHFLNAAELHGVDIDGDIIGEATEKGIRARRVDVEIEPLPFEDELFDLAFSLGMLDYLPTFDRVLEEANRVLTTGGYVLFSLPNLGSWNNRLALLLGFQPRDVEISDRAVVGAMPHYGSDIPAGHLHTATLRAFTELLELHGFECSSVTSGSWMTRDVPRAAAIVDRLLAHWPALARRYFCLARKVGSAHGGEPQGWWKGRDTLKQNQ